MIPIKHLLHWIPLLILLGILGLCIYFRLYEYLSFQSLIKYRTNLLNWRDHHYFLAVLIFILTYIISSAIALPSALFLGLLSGFLFGVFTGTSYVVLGGTMGGTVLFLSIRSSLGQFLAEHANNWVKKMEHGFQENAFNYLLTLRLLPLSPFWIVNIAAGLFQVRLKTFLMTTFLGIIPNSFIHVLVGNSVGSILDAGQKPNLSILFSFQVIGPLLALACFALLPVLYKKWKQKKTC